MSGNYLCLIDANFNRCKEGLRVIEDIFRFAFLDDKLRIESRNYRHRLTKIICPNLLKTAATKRCSSRDLGRKVDVLESKRRNLEEILYSNLQRVKESLRVLEEFSKLNQAKSTAKIKKLRYNVYELEKKAVIKWPSLCHNRQKGNRKK